MAKKVVGVVKLQLPAGKATPAPPVGPALGQYGVNIMEFVKQFNAKTANQPGMVIPAVLTVYADRSFTFVLKTPPASVLIRKAAGIEKGSGEPNKKKVATLTMMRYQTSGRPLKVIRRPKIPVHPARKTAVWRRIMGRREPPISTCPRRPGGGYRSDTGYR